MSIPRKIVKAYKGNTETTWGERGYILHSVMLDKQSNLKNLISAHILDIFSFTVFARNTETTLIDLVNTRKNTIHGEEYHIWSRNRQSHLLIFWNPCRQRRKEIENPISKVNVIIFYFVHISPNYATKSYVT